MSGPIWTTYNDVVQVGAGKSMAVPQGLVYKPLETGCGPMEPKGNGGKMEETKITTINILMKKTVCNN